MGQRRPWPRFSRVPSPSIRIPVSQFEPAPHEDPSVYPGRRPEHSYLFCGDHLLGLDRLDFVRELRTLGAVPLDRRHAVLAYGSNACPAQLAHKYRRSTCSPVIPMTRAWITGIGVGFSDHESRYGAVPATLFPAEDAVTEVFVAWLDRDQLADLDRTEAVNYERRAIDLGVNPLHVADGPSPARVDAYVSVRGLLTVDGVVPAVAAIETSYRAGPLLTQREAVELRRTDRLG